jgi:glucokinase
MPGFSIGVDLGGTNLRVAAVTPQGERLDHISQPTRLHAGPHAVLDDMVTAIRTILDRRGNSRIARRDPAPPAQPARL